MGIRTRRAAFMALALVCLVCGLGACGGSSRPSASAPSATATTTTPSAQTPATTPSTTTTPAAPPTAPSTTQTSPAPSSAHGSPAFKREHAALIALVACAREHGLDVSGPDAHNKIDHRRIDANSPHVKEVSKFCLTKVGEQARAEEQSKGP